MPYPDRRGVKEKSDLGKKQTGKPAPRGAGGKHKASFAGETPAELRKRAIRISTRLRKVYGHQGTALEFKNAYELLTATILSAQCTDAQVNKATPGLFAKYPDAPSLGRAKLPDVEKLIKSTGFFRQKAKSITSMAADITARFGGEVPEALEDLVTLAGVGRKTANCVRAGAFGKPGIIVDTHFKRLTHRMGLTSADNPDKIEAELSALLPESHWTEFSNSLIWHGRAVCDARKPACADCIVLKDCPYGRNNLPA